MEQNVKYYKDVEELGRHLRHARIAAGLKCKELAELSGIGESTISFWENGKVGDIEKTKAATTLAKFENALGIKFVKDDGIKKNVLDTNTSVVTYVDVQRGVIGKAPSEHYIYVTNEPGSAEEYVEQSIENLKATNNGWAELSAEALKMILGASTPDQHFAINSMTNQFAKFYISSSDVSKAKGGYVIDIGKALG